MISKSQRTLALWVVLLAFFMDLLDTTIVNVAIPSIQRALRATSADIQWIVAGYALTFAVCLIPGGRLGDIYGYRRIFTIGMAGFTATSAMCGLADSTGALIAARLLQGFTAALMVPQILALVQVMYAPNERTHVSAVYGALAGIATISGPILGAVLIAADLWGIGWRAIFLVNVPVGIASLALGLRYLPQTKSARHIQLDLTGAALALCAMVLLLFPLMEAGERGWPAWSSLCLLGSFAAFAAFGASQLRAQRRGGTPLVSPALFRTRSFLVGNVIAGAFFAVVSGFFLTFVLYLQVGLHYGVLEAGLTGVPFSLGVSVASAFTGSVLVPRFGRRVLSAGPVVMGCGFLWIALTSQNVGAAVTPLQLLPALVVSGIGMGFVVASIVTFTLADVPVHEAGAASGVVNAVDQVGGALGIAIFGAFFFPAALGGEIQRGFEHTLTALIGALLALGAATLLLPVRPRALEPTVQTAEGVS